MYKKTRGKNMNKEKVIVICGPTASGKTSLSIELAKKINGEVVSCDSMQIYKDMSIGTAKPTIEEMQGIKHYLIDYVSPEVRYSVAEYKKDAIKAIRKTTKASFAVLIQTKTAAGLPETKDGKKQARRKKSNGNRRPKRKFQERYKRTRPNKAAKKEPLYTGC